MRQKVNRNMTTRTDHILPVFFTCLTSFQAFKPFAVYVITVLRDFFFLQFAVKFGFKKIPIIHVDHELDEAVPFIPGMVHIYLDFVAFWIRPLGYVLRRFGRRVAIPVIVDFLLLVDRCYRDASEVYRYRMTTTDRPKYRRGKFLTIHLFDPHYLCVPSLHVIIVVLCYSFFRKTMKELELTETERQALDRELFAGAVQITETVLYIKQHSVNCIPAALYAMTQITPADVTPTEVTTFINALFIESPSVETGKAAAIREHIADMYEQLFLEGCNDDYWITPLQRWLNSYKTNC